LEISHPRGIAKVIYKYLVGWRAKYFFLLGSTLKSIFKYIGKMRAMDKKNINFLSQNAHE
jgi:hypothetical protein